MSVTLDHLLEPILPWLDDNAVEEICCQKAEEIWTFKHGKWAKHAVSGLDAEHVEDIGIVAGAQRRIDVWQDTPPLDTDLAGRGRISVIMRPLVEKMPSMTIRRGGDYWPTIPELREGGLFRKAAPKLASAAHPELVKAYCAAMATTDDEERSALLEQFFIGVAGANLTTLGAGVTASGKTSFLKACVRANPRSDERHVIIADTPEMVGLEDFFPNSVQLFYDRMETRFGMRGADLVIAALRMRPKKLIVQEVRDGEAALALFDGLSSGAKGMTTVHANSCDGAFERLKSVMKKTEAGAAHSDADILKQLRELIDVVVHFAARDDDDAAFAIDEIWFREAQE